MKAIHTDQRSPKFARRAILALSIGLAFALSGCGDASETVNATGTTTAPPQIEALFVDSAPDDAKSVVETRQEAKAGTTVTVVGRVAGAEEPFSAYYATLVLADDSVTTCERRPDDSCPTPWDACCEGKDVIASARVSVQIVGEDGRPIKQPLKGVHGLAELDTVIVTGTVAENSTTENVIINATAIYRQDS